MDFKEAAELLVPLFIAILGFAQALLTQKEKRKELREAHRELELLKAHKDKPGPPSATDDERAALEQKVVARELKVRRLNRLQAVSLIILPVGLILLGVATWRYWSPRPAGAAEVKITHPADGAMVAQREMVRGTSRDVPAGHTIWVVIYPHAAPRMYPQDEPAMLQANGGWSTLAAFGIERDAGQKFDAVAVVADRNAERDFRAYLHSARGQGNWAGLASLPAGATIYDRVTVMRR